MQDTGSLGLVHWDDPEEWYGEGGGKGVHPQPKAKSESNKLLFLVEAIIEFPL